ncbi:MULTISPECIES: type IV secretory system conjugative DNA transfer family protein [Lysobacteraceae]|uniref:type IV secretory system conjugative DNA transfer family protein n=1 Tax=Lysobacteraceae TaxID=32033 RepID=UPI0009BE8E30|nr:MULTISPECIES: type IV secretory system conjugative DNA transfer family protein [Xanthomonadaceae]MCC8799152.1 type IV secretion system DotC family protein [Xanthomonas euvesicatoria pv. euvesicatoria]MCC8807757.1 type IV secretion system DotC family protein [Xanthomonas euvesicatoria pv. euvesicatoria]MCC8816202.1 type IV secretion system DotC family protein [Xanthomonas euvesicatoria pv. euvesicatoria]
MAVSDTPPSLDQALSAYERNGAEVRVIDSAGELRATAIREDGLAYGVRAGLARRSYEIQQLLSKQAPQLDRTFDFNSLLMDRNVLPPVLTEASQVVQSEGNDILRITDKVYAIAKQAQFVTVAPSWRTYLVTEATFTYAPPEPYLAPKSGDERTVWKQAVTTGWKAGEEQADQILTESLNRLKRDYQGMLLYRRLLQQGVVSKPYVAEANYGITGDGDQVNINERMLRITALPKMQPSTQWKPIAVPATPIQPTVQVNP